MCRLGKLNGFPQRATFTRFRVISLSLHNIGRPALRDRNPLALLKEEGFCQNVTANHGVNCVVLTTVSPDPAAQLIERRNAILHAEGVPGEGGGKRRIADEVTTANDKVLGAVELKEK